MVCQGKPKVAPTTPCAQVGTPAHNEDKGRDQSMVFHNALLDSI